MMPARPVPPPSSTSRPRRRRAAANARALASTLLALACASACTRERAEPDASERAVKRDDPKASATSPAKVAAAPADDPYPEIPPGPVARVADVEIPRAAFLEMYQPLLTRTGRDTVPNSMKRRFQQRVLDRLMRQERLRLEAEASGVDYDHAAFDTQWAARTAMQDFAGYLKGAAETEATLRQGMIADLREKALVDKRVDVTVTDEDIAQAYEEAKPSLTSDRERLRTAHLALNIGPRRGDEHVPKPSPEMLADASEEDKRAWQEAALARATALREELLKPGVDFTEFVRAHSEGPSASRGGEMGYFDDRRMIPAYTAAAQALKIGELSQPVLTERGYYVIKLIDRQPPGTIPLAVLKDRLADSVRVRRLQRATVELGKELERKYPGEVLFELTRLNKK